MFERADQDQTLTFVVRLWREADACGQKHWCGRVEHIPSQEVGYVEDMVEVVRFMEHWTGGPLPIQDSLTG